MTEENQRSKGRRVSGQSSVTSASSPCGKDGAPAEHASTLGSRRGPSGYDAAAAGEIDTEYEHADNDAQALENRRRPWFVHPFSFLVLLILNSNRKQPMTNCLPSAMYSSVMMRNCACGREGHPGVRSVSKSCKIAKAKFIYDDSQASVNVRARAPCLKQQSRIKEITGWTVYA